MLWIGKWVGNPLNLYYTTSHLHILKQLEVLQQVGEGVAHLLGIDLKFQ